VIALISDFREMGAVKLSILGGEPTRYGVDQDHKPLAMVIDHAKNLGYKYVRLDTNGQFDEDIFEKNIFKELNEVSFSLDGFSPETHDIMRGEGTFIKCVSNIRRAVELGYKVSVTCCIHRKLAERDSKGDLLIDSMINVVSDLGVESLNFHVLFKPGFPMDTWTEETDIPWWRWVEIYPEVRKNIERNKYNISVRLPQRLIKREEFEKHPEHYGFCPAKLGERILIHPNGIIRICSGMLGTPYGVAKFYDNRIVWDESLTNELRDHQIDLPTPCTNQSKGKGFGNYVPLCFSFKPRQKEFVWQTIDWESKARFPQLAKVC
jgi:MoaA/NifB/PqqE/SkfB family radical SAM enzyme